MKNNKKTSITVFGGGHFQPGSWEYDEAQMLGTLLADNGFTKIFTGGFSGIMEAVAVGALDLVTGITLPEKPGGNMYLENTVVANDFYDRLSQLMKTDIHIYFPGRAGSVVELTADLHTVSKQLSSAKLIACYKSNNEWQNIRQRLLVLNFTQEQLDLVTARNSAEAVMELITDGKFIR